MLIPVINITDNIYTSKKRQSEKFKPKKANIFISKQLHQLRNNKFLMNKVNICKRILKKKVF